MATTTSPNLYAPEVWADLAQAEFVGRLSVGNLAVTDDTLVGQPGDEIDFPKWDALGELDDLTENVPMVPEAMRQSASKARIKEAGKAVEITDTAKLVGLGNAQDEAIRQFGILAARKVDTDLLAAAQATVAGAYTRPDGTVVGASAPLSLTLGAGRTVLDYDALVDAQALQGDELDLADYAGLVMNPADVAGLRKSDEFIAANQGANGNDAVLRGQLGTIAGLPIIITQRIAAKKAILVQRNSLAVLWKRRPIVEQDRDILKRTTVVATNMHYGVRRTRDKGITVITIANA